MVGIVTGSAKEEQMPAYRDHRDGVWRYRKWVTLPSGKRTRIKGTPDIDTKSAAEDAERKHIERLMNPSAPQAALPPAKEVPTIRAYSEIFMNGYAAAHKPSELASKRRILAAQLLKWFGETRLDELTQADVDAFRAARLKSKVSRKTVNNELAILSSLLKYAAKNKERPAVDLDFVIKVDEAELVALRPEQVDLLLHAAGDDPRYTAAVLLGVDAGFRIGEVRALEWTEVDDIHRRVTVARSIDPAGNQTSAKNRQRRTIDASERLWAALAALTDRRPGAKVVGHRAGKRAGEPLGYSAMNERLHALYVAAGVPAPKKPWHCLRHTFCTELARRGVPMHIIAELAGHESLETTRRYVHATAADRRAAIETLSVPAASPRRGGTEDLAGTKERGP